MDILTQIKNLFIRVIYGNDVELLYHPNRHDQSMLTMEAVAGASGLALMQGTFQQGFLILMGASDQILAYLPILGSIAGLAAIFGGLVFDKRKKRKGIIVTMLLIARLLLAFIVFVPLVLPKPACVPVILCMIIIASILSNIADVGYNSWLIAIVPPKIRGRFMAVRTTICQLILPILPVVAAAFLDKASDKYIAFIILFAIGGVLIIAEAAIMSKVDEPEYVIPHDTKLSPRKMLKLLHNEKPFVSFLLYTMLFYFFLYISGSFTSMYMLKYNKLSYTMVSLAGTYSTVIMLLLYKRWGRFCDEAGAGKVLFISQALFALEMFSWVVVPPALLQYLLLIPYTFQSLSNSGFGIAMYTRKYDYIPEENRNFFTGVMTASIAIPLLLGPMVGNFIKGKIETNAAQWVLDGLWQFRFLYLIASLLLLLLSLFTYLKKRKFEV